MPNWVRNKVRMKGIAKQPLFTTGEDGKQHFDFNKLIPMPKELDMVSGSPEKDAICELILSLAAKRFLPIDVNGESYRNRNEDQTPEKKQELLENGLQYASNLVKYGATTWYDWCCQNWGTKWNACETVIISDDEIQFDTAWSNPEPIIRALADRYQEAEIEHIWADEDQGSNTGFREWAYGEWAECYDDDCSNEAYERYIECWGSSDCLYQDDDGLWQRHSCEDCDGCK